MSHGFQGLGKRVKGLYDVELRYWGTGFPSGFRNFAFEG